MTAGTKRLGRRTTFLAIAGLILVGAATPAHADDAGPQDHVSDAIAELIRDVAPGTDEPIRGELIGDSIAMSTDIANVSVPVDPAEDIAVSTTVDGKTIEASISLPDSLSVGAGTVADDGTVVYVSSDDDAQASDDAIAVQTLSDGSTRVQTIIGSADSTHEFSYSMEGFAPVKTDDRVLFISNDDSGTFVPLAAAWAVDANGATVETYYEIRGEELVQVVVPSGDTAYPIVADPSWVWVGAGWGMKLTRSETASVRDYAAAIGMCAIFTKGAPGVAIACSVYGSYMQLQANLAESDSPRTCLFLNVVPAPGSIWRVSC